MLSERTVRNLCDAFLRAAAATLVRQAGHRCAILPSAAPWNESKTGGRVLLMTISSFTFRLITVFQLSDEQPTRDYYTAGTADKDLDATFSEFANMCCGALGRELFAQFRHIGMSIPYLLEWQCAKYLQDLSPRLVSSYDIAIEDTARIKATLCVCCERQLEFAPPVIDSAQSSGDLELL
ncbi:MAG TPA: hypothetical protein VNX02_08205 [Steroidobacteraceae bacterium]|jgi:hypothetical protein|nr:hypothetical protein [Steroidobacteraceae bacterium]